MMTKKKPRAAGTLVWPRHNRHKHDKDIIVKYGLFQPSVYHALVVIFLEFFSWGLVMSPVITVLNDMFPHHAFLMNGLIQGVKGLLSFLAAPLIGALSDVWGRKPFLLLTVTFTCAPIPLMKFSPWWYFAMISISGIFAVTFSIVFAYVADVTTEEDRSAAYGLVSATFAASLVTSPAIGAYLGNAYSDNLVIALATAVAVLDVFFILVAVPESLPEKCRPASWGTQIAWEKADPFGALRKIGQDFLILMLCVTVFFSYLPEAGEYSSFFVYLRLVMGFNQEEVATFVAVVGVLSVIAQCVPSDETNEVLSCLHDGNRKKLKIFWATMQTRVGMTLVLALLMRYLGSKHSIIIGLVFELLQLFMLGFGSQPWIIWSAGVLAAMGSITYPSISAFVSAHASDDQQGVAQGIITGIRGLCNGLGPALFGFIFYLFHVDLEKTDESTTPVQLPNVTQQVDRSIDGMLRRFNEGIMPGPPFAFGAILVILALIVALFIPENPHTVVKSPTSRRVVSPLSRENELLVEQEYAEFAKKSHEHVPLMDDNDSAS